MLVVSAVAEKIHHYKTVILLREQLRIGQVSLDNCIHDCAVVTVFHACMHCVMKSTVVGCRACAVGHFLFGRARVGAYDVLRKCWPR